MSRPAQRALRKLPTLETRRAELETCAFCPKLCRSACPVSNAQPTEALIPWGKMIGAYEIAIGDAAPTAGNALPAWGCTGCLACREVCEHRNPVANTLFDARSEFYREGIAPEAAQRAAARFWEREREAPHRITETAKAPIRLLVGCGYLRNAAASAGNAVAVARAVLGESVAIHDACCGLPLLFAGDKDGFARAVEALDASVGEGRLVIVDAGCAYGIGRLAGETGVRRKGPQPELLVDLVAAELGRFVPGGAGIRDVVFHDSCALGRGLGIYEAPRRVVRHVVGEPPQEFLHSHEGAHCSGAGGLLPLTMPEVSRAITEARVSAPEAPASAAIVTTCASSLRAFRRSGKVAYDLNDLVARAIAK